MAHEEQARVLRRQTVLLQVFQVVELETTLRYVQGEEEEVFEDEVIPVPPGFPGGKGF